MKCEVYRKENIELRRNYILEGVKEIKEKPCRTNNKLTHDAVLTLLFADILTSEEANKLHEKIDKRIKD